MISTKMESDSYCTVQLSNVKLTRATRWTWDWPETMSASFGPTVWMFPMAARGGRCGTRAQGLRLPVGGAGFAADGNGVLRRDEHERTAVTDHYAPTTLTVDMFENRRLVDKKKNADRSANLGRDDASQGRFGRWSVWNWCFCFVVGNCVVIVGWVDDLHGKRLATVKIKFKKVDIL